LSPAIQPATALARIRATCLALPDTSERLSHGAPTFFIGAKRAFVIFHNDHHGDGRLAIWCAAPDGEQQALVDADPDLYFVPPYVGNRGWLGARLDRRLSWAEINAIVENAYLAACRPRSEQHHTKIDTPSR
jgi:hypothetical protein